MSNKPESYPFHHPFNIHFCKQLWVQKDLKKLSKDYDLEKLANHVSDEKYDLIHIFFLGLRNNSCYCHKDATHAYLYSLMELTQNRRFKDKDGNNYLHVLANYIREGKHIDDKNGTRHSYLNDLKSLSYAYEFFSVNYPEMNSEENNSKHLPGDYLLRKFKQPYESENNTFTMRDYGDTNYYSVLHLYKVEQVRESLTLRSRLSLKDKLIYFDNLIDHCNNAARTGTLTAREDMKNLLSLLMAVKEKNNLNRTLENGNENEVVEVKTKKRKI